MNACNILVLGEDCVQHDPTDCISEALLGHMKQLVIKHVAKSSSAPAVVYGKVLSILTISLYPIIGQLKRTKGRNHGRWA